MKNILLDTDVLIEHLRTNQSVSGQLLELHRRSDVILAYTPVTEAEIFQGLRSNEKQKTEKVLGYFNLLPINQSIGRAAGYYLRKYSRSHGLELPDALIAATASFHKFELCTFNWKHYPMQDVKHYRMER